MLWLAHDDTFTQLIQRGEVLPFVAIMGGVTIAIVAIVFTSLRGIASSRTREQTKREIAAYVAEGSISPDQAVAMLEAGKDASTCCGTKKA